MFGGIAQRFTKNKILKFQFTNTSDQINFTSLSSLYKKSYLEISNDSIRFGWEKFFRVYRHVVIHSPPSGVSANKPNTEKRLDETIARWLRNDKMIFLAEKLVRALHSALKFPINYIKLPSLLISFESWRGISPLATRVDCKWLHLQIPRCQRMCCNQVTFMRRTKVISRS